MIAADARIIAASERFNRQSNLADIEEAEQAIKTAAAKFEAALQVQAETLPLSDEEKRWINPETNGFQDMLSDVFSTLKAAKKRERD